MATTPPVPEQDEPQGIQLTPLDLSQYPPRGKYASFDVSDQDMFGPDELGEYKSAVDDLSDTCTRADSAARNFEVLQAWEARLFGRNYQFLNSGKGGWGLFGGVNGARASGQEIMQSQNAGKLFSCNVYGQRMRKFMAAIARDVPDFTFSPKRSSDPVDQTAADEAKKYHQVWIKQAGIKEVAAKIARLQYTDDRVLLYTRSVADEQQWGTETPDQQQEGFGTPSPDGVTPEMEMQPQPEQGDMPAVREITTVYGKLEHKCPLYADTQAEMAWQRISTEVNQNILKERYPWIREKIKPGGAGSKNGGGADQLDRQARINVRLAVQSSASSGESWQQDATETYTWYRPSQYHAIAKEEVRELFFETFPDGLLVVHAGGELAFIRNESMDDHLSIIHPYEGDGQNRDSVGNNYLPLQKILNANISLADRYFRAAVPRRFALEGPIDVSALNSQPNDPNKVIPIEAGSVPSGQTIDNITSVEKVPSPNSSMLEFIQWLIEGAPEAMDGMSPAMFGMEDADTYGATKLNRDQALQVLSMPWSHMCLGLADAAQQAVECGARNRISNLDANIPGEGRIVVELSKLQGNVICEPESMEIPQTIAEQEAQMAELLENSKNVALYQAIANDPLNLPHMAKFPSLNGLNIPGLGDVEQQQGELELLSQSGPLPNPQIALIQQQLQMAQGDPEAATPDGIMALQQLMQALQQLQQTKPLVSSVPVAQNASENHAIHAVVMLDAMNSAEGRKLKNGTDQQKAIYQNWELHWQAHVEMGQQLTPPKQIEIKGNVSIDPTKLPPEAQAKAWQAIGLEVSPQELTDDHALVPHEVVTEKEGLDANGVPVKQKIAMSNPNGRLN